MNAVGSLWHSVSQLPQVVYTALLAPIVLWLLNALYRRKADRTSLQLTQLQRDNERTNGQLRRLDGLGQMQALVTKQGNDLVELNRKVINNTTLLMQYERRDAEQQQIIAEKDALIAVRDAQIAELLQKITDLNKTLAINTTTVTTTKVVTTPAAPETEAPA